MRLIYIIIIGLVLTSSLFFYFNHAAVIDVKQGARPFVNLRSTNASYTKSAINNTVKDPNHSNWVDILLNRTLKNERMLRDHVLSKERIWRSLEVRPNQWEGSAPRVLVYLGWVAFWNMEKFALNGGASGEFAVFADLVTGLSAVGYNISVVHTMCDFWDIFQNHTETFDVVITDYDGLGTAENMGHFPAHHCKYYLVDFFGTQAARNKRNLDLKRILTPYPYDGSNSAIYFVISELAASDWHPSRENQGVLWAKEFKHIAPRIDAVSFVSKMTPLHSTYSKQFGVRHELLPKMEEVQNHEYMKRVDFMKLLSASKFLLGVGAPIDGPTALEAIAHGCAFINPKVPSAVRHADKPNDIPRTSQHLFAEKFFSPPHVYTIDIDNTTELESTIRTVLATPSVPFVHPHNTAKVYVENLRDVFSRQQLCVAGETPIPHKHPANNVYNSFVDFVINRCGRDDYCPEHWVSERESPTQCVQRMMGRKRR